MILCWLINCRLNKTDDYKNVQIISWSPDEVHTLTNKSTTLEITITK